MHFGGAKCCCVCGEARGGVKSMVKRAQGRKCKIESQMGVIGGPTRKYVSICMHICIHAQVRRTNSTLSQCVLFDRRSGLDFKKISWNSSQLFEGIHSLFVRGDLLAGILFWEDCRG